jgi:hypothetical protein
MQGGARGSAGDGSGERRIGAMFVRDGMRARAASPCAARPIPTVSASSTRKGTPSAPRGTRWRAANSASSSSRGGSASQAPGPNAAPSVASWNAHPTRSEATPGDVPWILIASMSSPTRSSKKRRGAGCCLASPPDCWPPRRWPSSRMGCGPNRAHRAARKSAANAREGDPTERRAAKRNRARLAGARRAFLPGRPPRSARPDPRRVASGSAFWCNRMSTSA